MSSDPLMMDYEGGDLLTGAACGRLLGHCPGLCVQVMGGDLNKRPGGSVSVTKMRVRGVLYMRCAIQIDVFTFSTFFSNDSDAMFLLLLLLSDFPLPKALSFLNRS